MSAHRTLLPEGWPRPSGYSNGIVAEGRMVFTAGVVGWDSEGRFASSTLAGQFEQVLANTVAILAEGGARPEHVVRMTCYLTSRDDYVAQLPEIGAAWRRHMGKSFPAMAVVEISALVEPEAVIEVETIAVIPA
jgi:enamine deaminase RidA (YjgF/YER057c/UK114 family)